MWLICSNQYLEKVIEKNCIWVFITIIMGDSSSDDESSCILYKNRPEWKDVEPVPQDDGDSGVVSIQYTERCRSFYLHVCILNIYF